MHFYFKMYFLLWHFLCDLSMTVDAITCAIPLRSMIPVFSGFRDAHLFLFLCMYYFSYFMFFIVFVCFSTLSENARIFQRREKVTDFTRRYPMVKRCFIWITSEDFERSVCSGAWILTFYTFLLNIRIKITNT